MYKKVLITASLLFFIGCNNDASLTDGNSPDSYNTRVGIPTLKYSVVAGGVATTSQIIVNFASTMNTSTLNSTNILLEDSTATPVGFTLLASSSSLTITPDSELAVNSKYTLTLTQGIMYDSNQTLDKNYTYELYTSSTSGVADTYGPELVTSSPKDANQSASVYTAFSFTFNEDITVAGVQVLINGDNNTTLTQGNNNLLARPNTTLDYNRSYTIDLVGIQDISGNPYLGQTSFTFKTQEAPSSLHTYDINGSTGNILVSAIQHSVLVPYEDNITTELISMLDINGSQLYEKTNNIQAFSTPVSASTSYDRNFFVGSQTSIGYIPGDLIGNGHLLPSLDINLSFMHANADFMCVLSTESQQARFYSLYRQTNYEFFQPAYEETGINPLSCYVSTLNSNEAYVSTNTAVNVYMTDPTTTQVFPSTPIPEGNVTSITTNNTHSFFLRDSKIMAYFGTTFEGSFDINVSFTQIHAYENLVYASSANTNEIYIINVSTPSTMFLQHIIPTSAIVKNFDFIDDKLVAGYVTTTLSTAVELFDVSSLNVAPIKEVATSQTITYKSLSSELTAQGYNITVGDTIVISKNGQEVLSKIPSYPAVNFSFFSDSETGDTHIALAQPTNGVELLRIVLDANQTPVDIVSEANITNVGTVNAVFVGEIGFDDITTYAYTNKLLIGSVENGLLQYDIDTPNTPIYEFNNTNFTAISDFTMGYEDNASNVIIYISDFGAHDVKRLVYTDYNTSSITHTIPTPSAPRGIHTDYTTGHTFVALGAAGLLAIDGSTQQTTLLPTPGYAMDVDSAAQYSHDTNTSVLQGITILVADFTGSALFSLDSTNGFDLNSDFHYNAFVEHSGNIYTTSIIKNYDEVRGAISYTHSSGKSFVFGHYEGATSTQPYDFNDPVQYIEFNDTNTIGQPTIGDINDPFL